MGLIRRFKGKLEDRRRERSEQAEYERACASLQYDYYLYDYFPDAAPHRRLAIGAGHEVDLLRKVGAIPALREPYRVLNLNPACPLGPREEALADQLIEASDVVLDLSGSKRDRFFRGDPPRSDNREGSTYIAEAINPTEADGFLTFQSCLALSSGALKAIAEELDGNERPRVLTVGQMKSISRFLSAGHEELSFPGHAGNERVSLSSDVRPYLGFQFCRLMPAGNKRIRERTEAIWRMEDLGMIWARAISSARESGEIAGGSEVLKATLGTRYYDKGLGTTDRAINLFFEKLGRSTGAAVMVDAYYDGVPLEDILA